MSDYILVNSNGTTYQVDMENAGSIQPTDYVLVNRDGVTYKAPGDSIAPPTFSSVTLAPLSGTPNYEITAVTDISSIPEGATAVYSWYRYNSATGDDGKTLIITVATSEVSNTYTTSPLDQGKYIGCTVSYLGNRISAPIRSAASEADIPIATMYGLRQTQASYWVNMDIILEDNYTMSFWYKPLYQWPTTGQYSAVVSSGGVYADNSCDIGITNLNDTNGGDTGEVNLYIFSVERQGNYGLNIGTLKKFEWNHICFNVKDGLCSVWINGEPCNYNGPDDPTVPGVTVKFNWVYWGDSGTYFSNARTLGYYSDIYCVDGQVLEPTTFGKEYLLGWGPLDHTIIENSIGAPPKSPYDTRPNMEKEWSSEWTSRQDNAANAFNGSLTGTPMWADGLSNNQPGTMTWVPVNPIPISSEPGSLQIYGTYYGTGTISLNGTNINDQFVDSEPQNWYTITGFSQIENMLFTANDGSNTASMWAIKVNGRILVDGPVNNSQNWSSFVSPGGSGFGPQIPANAFNGSFSGQGWGGDSGVEYLMTIPGGIPCSSIRFYCNSGGSYSPSDFLINGSQSINSSVGGALQWTPATTVNGGTLNTIRFPVRKNDSDGWTVWAIEVDGELLVDSGAQWNTSQIWSDYGTGTPYNENYLWKYAFNGELNTTYWALAIDGTVYTWEPPTGVQFNNLKLKFVGELNPQIKLNGASYVEISSPGTGEWDYEITTPGTLEGLKLPCTNGAVYVGLKQITIDDEVLVDAASFGSNGFYLPLNPDAEGGVLYSQGQITGEPYDASYTWNYAFNGWLGTGASGLSATEQYTLTLSEPVQFEKLIIYVKNNTASIYINNAEVSLASATGSGEDYELDATDLVVGNVLEKLGVLNDATIRGVRVDGVLLVDHNGIGEDASGNNNNFRDMYFAVGNTSRVWSDTVTPSSPDGGAIPSIKPSETVNPIQHLFDGTVTTPAQVDSNNGYTARISFDPPITGNNIEIYVDQSGTASNKTANGDSPLTLNGWNKVNGNTLNYIQAVSTAGSGYFWLNAIKVDGKILVDANIQDTVLDTPLTDYAVFAETSTETGLTEGNLARDPQAAGAATSWLSVNDKFNGSDNVYLELTVPEKGDSRDVFVGFCSNEDERLQYGNTTNFVTGGADGMIVSGVDWELADTTTNVGVLYRGSSVQLFENFVNTFNKDISGVQYFGIDRAAGIGGTKDVVANFGQQGFANPIVTDNGNGTVTVDLPNNEPYANRPNMDEKWSDGCSANRGSGSTTHDKAFDNDKDTYWNPTSYPSGVTFSPALPAGTITMDIDANNTSAVKINGVQMEVFTDIGKQTVTYTLADPITSIEFVETAGSTSGATWLYYIEHNGRLLVDGPADMSQRWGQITTGTEYNNPSYDFSWASAFTGEGFNESLVGTVRPADAVAFAASNLSYAVIFDSPIDPNGQMTVYGGRSTEGTVKLLGTNNDVLITDYFTTSTLYEKAEIDSANLTPLGLLRGLEITTGQGDLGGFVGAVMVDNKKLIDGGAQWNSSQAWSSGTNPDDWGDLVPVTNLFDGDLSTYTYSEVQDAYTSVTWSAITANSSIRVYGRGTTNSWRVIVDGNPVSVEFSGNDPAYDSWRTLDTTFPCQVTGIQNNNPGAVYAIEVDGKVLVDPIFAGGPVVCNKIFRTWTEAQAAFFKSELDRLGNYEAALKAVAAAYDVNGSYDEGAIVSHEGQLWQAVANSAQVTTPTLSATTVWNRLGIKV